MEVQVEHALPCLFSDIGYDAEAFHALFLRDFCDHLKTVGNYRAVGIIHLRSGADVLLGNHEEMRRRLGIDIIKGIAQLVLIDLFGRDIPQIILQNRQSLMTTSPF